MQYDVGHIRIMGILQRVAVCYYAVALMEIFLPRSKRYRNYNEPESTRGRFNLCFGLITCTYCWILWLFVCMNRITVTYSSGRYGLWNLAHVLEI